MAIDFRFFGIGKSDFERVGLFGEIEDLVGWQRKGGVWVRFLLLWRKRRRGRGMQGKYGKHESHVIIALTQRGNGWHVLIDACALGPKDMDSFGLSLFQPDFLICSFYKVFGENPSGFGCLFVKKSAITTLESSSCLGCEVKTSF